MNQKLKKLGFREGKEAIGVVGCCTIPCFQGKMPHQSWPTVPCVIIRSMCDKSPFEQMSGRKASTNQRSTDDTRQSRAVKKFAAKMLHKLRLRNGKNN
jgi:hypothetical protein